MDHTLNALGIDSRKGTKFRHVSGPIEQRLEAYAFRKISSPLKIYNSLKAYCDEVVDLSPSLVHNLGS